MRPIWSLWFFGVVALPGLVACNSSKSSAGDGGAACAGGAAYCFTPDTPETTISAALGTLQDGDVVTFAAGLYKFNNQLALGAAKNVTIEGAGASTVFDFSTQQVAGDAVFVQSPAAGVTFKSFAITNSPGNAIKALGVNGLTFDALTVSWTAPDATTHGAYGIYPVQSTNVVIKNSTVSGANDSGIYVGQSKNVVVEHNEAFQNVAGIEIENTYVADVHDNHAHDNTAGILVFGLPGLEQEGGHQVRVFSNVIENNNTSNFAAKGDIVSIVPAGTGFFVMACTNVEVYGNTFTGNGTVASAVISYFLSQLPIADPAYYPYSGSTYFHDNTFSGNGTSPDLKSQIGLLFLTGQSAFPGGHSPDVVFDGIVTCPVGAADGGVTDAGADAGGCGVAPMVVGPADNPLDVCVKEANAQGICNLHLDQLNASNSNLAQIMDCDAGYLGCTLPSLTGVTGLGN